MLRTQEAKLIKQVRNNNMNIKRIIQKDNKDRRREEFDQRMIQLGELRRDIKAAKSLLLLTQLVSNNADLKNHVFSYGNLNNKTEIDKLSIIKSRVLNYVDNIMSMEIMRYYRIKRK